MDDLLTHKHSRSTFRTRDELVSGPLGAARSPELSRPPGGTRRCAPILRRCRLELPNVRHLHPNRPSSDLESDPFQVFRPRAACWASLDSGSRVPITWACSSPDIELAHFSRASDCSKVDPWSGTGSWSHTFHQSRCTLFGRQQEQVPRAGHFAEQKGSQACCDPGGVPPSFLAAGNMCRHLSAKGMTLGTLTKLPSENGGYSPKSDVSSHDEY